MRVASLVQSFTKSHQVKGKTHPVSMETHANHVEQELWLPHFQILNAYTVCHIKHKLCKNYIW